MLGQRKRKLSVAVEHEFFSNLPHYVHLRTPLCPLSFLAPLNLFDKAAALNATLCPGHSNCCSCSCRYNCVTPSHSLPLSLSLSVAGFLVDKFGKYKPVVVMSLLLNAIFHHSLLFIPQQEIPGVVPSAFVMRHPESGDIEVSRHTLSLSLALAHTHSPFLACTL